MANPILSLKGKLQNEDFFLETFTAVGIYCHGHMGFKVFDSHARDLYGRSNINGTCVLLELPSLNCLIYYFQSIHNIDIFEIKEVKIENVQAMRIQLQTI